MSFRYPDFSSRTPQFAEGFYAWFEGRFDNPYIEFHGGRARASFLPSREWQHGQDVAFLLNQYSLTEANDND